MQLHQNDLWTISYDEAVSSVKIDWTEKTAHMTDDDFKDALSRFAGHAEEHSARCLLVDVQRFKHALSEELGQWRDSTIIPRYNAVNTLQGFGSLRIHSPLEVVGNEDENEDV